MFKLIHSSEKINIPEDVANLIEQFYYHPVTRSQYEFRLCGQHLLKRLLFHSSFIFKSQFYFDTTLFNSIYSSLYYDANILHSSDVYIEKFLEIANNSKRYNLPDDIYKLAIAVTIMDYWALQELYGNYLVEIKVSKFNLYTGTAHDVLIYVSKNKNKKTFKDYNTLINIFESTLFSS